MNGIALRIVVHENRKQDHILAYEWLLEHSRALGISGGSATRALAGFGRTGVMRAERFYELGGDLPVVVEFACTATQADALLALMETVALRAFYTRTAIEYGVVGGDDAA